MKIEHIAIWVADLEKSKRFYIKYFNMTSSAKYENTNKKFSSYFLSFGTGRSRIELMHHPSISECDKDKLHIFGLTHMAISVGDKQAVNKLTERFRADGFEVMSEARTTGDGYYESVIIDHDGNQIELTV